MNSIVEWAKQETQEQRDQCVRVLFDARRKTVAENIERARQSDRKVSTYTRVYFVQESSCGAIKIGSSKNVKKRLGELRVGTPGELEILAAIEGGTNTEKLLQFLFSHVRIRGEWFRPAPELIEYIEAAAIEGAEFEKREREALFEKVRNMKVLA